MSKKISKGATATWCAFVLMSMSGIARADRKGEEILRKYEQSFKDFQDQYGKFVMRIRNRDGVKNVYFTLYNTPGWKRLLKFTKPADVRGQMFLVLSEHEMYVYLPAFRRVRRVAGHVRNQSFMASDFAFDDMMIGQWSHNYSAQFLKEDKTYWYLALSSRQGKKPPFPRLKMRINKRMRQADLIEYYGIKGRKLRTQSFLNWTCQSGDKLCYPSRVRFTDHRKSDHVTDLDTIECRYNVGISARKFTLRYLARGS